MWRQDEIRQNACVLKSCALVVATNQSEADHLMIELHDKEGQSLRPILEGGEKFWTHFFLRIGSKAGADKMVEDSHDLFLVR